MKKKIGFIGCGNMGTAMIHGMLDSKECAPEDIIASAKSQKSIEAKSQELGITMVDDNSKVAEFADVLFLAVKPQFYEAVIDEIKEKTNYI